jgi:hypothetical protein
MKISGYGTISIAIYLVFIAVTCISNFVKNGTIPEIEKK